MTINKSASLQTWLLPEYVEDVLPPVAHAIEALRRHLLDHFQAKGYELVMPPLLEHLESLLSATGHDLELATFKLVDELSGRSLGLRADHTPQVTRIDAHLLNRPGVTRLCYCGPVLHTRPSGLSKSREPLQIGAELYGFAGLEADIEIICLMSAALALTGVRGLHVEIGHPGVFNALVAEAKILEPQRMALFSAIASRDQGAIADAADGCSKSTKDAFITLPQLNGDGSMLTRAKALLPDLKPITEAIAALTTLNQALVRVDAAIGFDFAELGGFHYEQGIVFAAFAPGLPDAIARGGRYDEVGSTFGRARPATGFTLDLKQLARLVPAMPPASPISAPWQPEGDIAPFEKTVTELRSAGEVVVQRLPGEVVSHGNRALKRINNEWQVITT